MISEVWTLSFCVHQEGRRVGSSGVDLYACVYAGGSLDAFASLRMHWGHRRCFGWRMRSGMGSSAVSRLYVCMYVGM